MAKTKGLQYPNSKTSLFLCCFGSFAHKTDSSQQPTVITGSDHNPKQKSGGWLPWQRIRFRLNNLTTKTVPLESSSSDEKEKPKLESKGRADKAHSSKWKNKSKSNLNKSSLNTQTPATNPTPPSILPPTPSQSEKRQRNQENNTAEDTRQQSSSSPPRVAAASAAAAMSRAVSLPIAKRQMRRLLSSMQPQTTSKPPGQVQNAKRLNPVVGTSVVMVTLVIMVLWGRVCAILCSSVWLYFIPRFRMALENDDESSNNNSNDLDLDSEAYKKKVVLEGLLERKHRATL